MQAKLEHASKLTTYTTHSVSCGIVLGDWLRFVDNHP